MKCPQCGYENSQDAPFCNLCQAGFGTPKGAAIAAASAVTIPSAGGSALPSVDASLSSAPWTFEVRSEPGRLEIVRRLSTLYRIAGTILLVPLTLFMLVSLAKVFSHPIGALVMLVIWALVAAGVGITNAVVLDGSARSVAGWSTFFGKRIDHETRHVRDSDSVTVTREWRSSRRSKWEVLAVAVRHGDDETDLVESHADPEAAFAVGQCAAGLLRVELKQRRGEED